MWTTSVYNKQDKRVLFVGSVSEGDKFSFDFRSCACACYPVLFLFESRLC